MFDLSEYRIRRNILNWLGIKLIVRDAQENMVLCAEQKAFKLKEDIRLYADEAKQHEVLNIQARNIIDFSSGYDVFDSVTKQKIGSLHRKGFKSLLRDEWIIMDDAEQQIGMIQEDSQLLALIRRFLTNLIPQSYTVRMGHEVTAEFKQDWNPLVIKLNLVFKPASRLDRRLGIAAGILLCCIDGHQG